MADAFETFKELCATYGYPALFVGVLLENAGLPVPGETAVLVAGFLASPAGGNHFSVGWVIAITIVAAVVGDNIGFWLGHRFARPRLQQGKRFLFLTPKALELAEGYFARYGLWTIFFQRFITGLRVVGAVAAGTAGMPWTRFLVANASGALAWAVAMTLLGYFFGHSWELLHYYIGRGGLILLGTVVVFIGLPYLLRRLKTKFPDHWERFAGAQIVQGVLAAVLEIFCIGLLLVIAHGRHVTLVDHRINEWLEMHELPIANALAFWGHLPASLPIVIVVTCAMIAFLWRQERSWRESAALIWALVASECVGLLVVGLLHFWDIKPIRAGLWPFGYAGLVPLRALAVYGMIAHVIRRENRRAGQVFLLVTGVLVVWTGFSVIYPTILDPDTGGRLPEQFFTELLLEYAAGGIVLFAGIWWLEGFGPGLVGPAAEVRPVPSPDSAMIPRAPADPEQELAETAKEQPAEPPPPGTLDNPS
jgi:membrane-associated protein